MDYRNGYRGKYSPCSHDVFATFEWNNVTVWLLRVPWTLSDDFYMFFNPLTRFNCSESTAEGSRTCNKLIKRHNAHPLIITTGCNPSFTGGAWQAAASHPGNSVITLSGFAPPAHKEQDSPAAVGKLVRGRTSQHETETQTVEPQTLEPIRNNTVGPVGGRLQNSNTESGFSLWFPKMQQAFYLNRKEKWLWHLVWWSIRKRSSEHCLF